MRPAALPVLGPLFAALYREVLPPAAAVDERLRAGTLHPERVDPDLRRRLVELARVRRGFPEGPRAYADGARSLLAYLVTPWGMLADAWRVRCPVLVIHGEQDRLVAAHLAREIVRWRRHWRLAVLDECGHLPSVEQPDAVVDAIAGADAVAAESAA